jgi:hypothetical protein
MGTVLQNVGKTLQKSEISGYQSLAEKQKPGQDE